MFPDLPYVSLEPPDVRDYATRDPRGFLADHADGAILDEVQRVPDLLSYVQGDVDARPRPGRFVLTGSANLALLGAVSQSLAGRTALLTLLPLSLDEVRRFAGAPTDLLGTLWTGGYPAILDRQVDPADWLSAYVGTYVERDVRQLVNVESLTTFQTFLRLAAGRSAQLLNLSAFGADAGVTHGTNIGIRFDLLGRTPMVTSQRPLQCAFETPPEVTCYRVETRDSSGNPVEATFSIAFL